MPMDVAQMGKLVDYTWRNTIQETESRDASFWDWCNALPAKQTNTLGEKWMVRTAYNQSESWAKFDGDAYAQPGNSQFQNLYVPYRTVSMQFSVTKEAIDNYNGNAHYNPVADEIASTKTHGYQMLNRHGLMSNATGRIGIVANNYSGGTPAQLTLDLTANFGAKGSQFVPETKKVQVYDPTGTTLRNGTIGGEGIVTIATNNRATGVITGTSNFGSDVVANDIVIPERSAQRTPHGLPYWVNNTGNLFDLSRSTYPGLKSTVIDGSSGAILLLVETMVSQQAFQVEQDIAYGTAEVKGGDYLWWSPTQRERYRKEAIGTGITMLGSEKVDLGFGYKETINGMPTMTSRDHDNTKIHRLRRSDWYRLTLGDADEPFVREKVHGADMYNLYDALGRVTSGYGCVFTGYVNFACSDVRSQAVINNLPTSGLATGNV